MASILRSVNDWFLGSSVRGLFPDGKMYLYVAPEDAVKPVCVFFPVSSTPEFNLSDGYTENKEFQFNIITDSDTEAESIGDQFMAALDWTGVPHNAGKITGCRRLIDRLEYDATNREWTKVLSYMVTYPKTVGVV